MKILSMDSQSYQTINEISNHISSNLEKILLYKEKPSHPLEPFIVYFLILKNHPYIEKYEFKINQSFRTLNIFEIYILNEKIKKEIKKHLEKKEKFFLYYNLLINQILYKLKKEDNLRTKPSLARKNIKLLKEETT